MSRRSFNAVALGIGWLLSLGAVFVLGILSAFALHLSPESAGRAQGDLSLEQRGLLLVLEQYTGKPGDIAAILEVGSGPEVPEQLEQAIRAILREGDPVERQMASTHLVRGLPSRRVMDCIRFLQKVPGSPARDEVLGRFLEAWAEGDGRSAIAFAVGMDSQQERELAIQAALDGWSRGRPSEAWNWVIERAGGSRRAERWLEIILTNLAQRDRETALDLVGQMVPGDFQTRMSLVVMEQVLDRVPPREAITWIGELPQGASAEAGTLLAAEWAQTEPEAAAEWFQTAFPGEEDGLAVVLGEWVYLDAESAADWVLANLPPGPRGAVLGTLAEEWLANDGPTPLAEWLNRVGAQNGLDGAIEALALATAPVDPATALVWAQSAMDPDTRSMLEILIGQEWIRQAPEAAADALPVLLESEAARAALFEEAYFGEDAGIVEEEVPLAEGPAPVQ